jgi:RNA-directed DNA polymerase
VSFYFQEIADDNGLRNNIEIISIGWSIEKVTRNIKNITYIKKEEFRDENENQLLSEVIKNIYKVLDLWVNYYKHTDYAVGLERIEQSFNKKIQWFI